MRSWVIAGGRGKKCGGWCGQQIEPGQPMLIIELAAGKKYRCEQCAGESANLPDETPESRKERVAVAAKEAALKLTGAAQQTLEFEESAS